MVEEVKIPQPPPSWILGNLPDIDASQLMISFNNLHKLYGPIYRLDINGTHFVRIGTQSLCHEVCDDTRFEKKVIGPLYQVRHLTGSGLFTSDTEEPDWQLAHKLLMPVFGPLAIQKMFPQMLDITGQMIMKWQRMGDNELIDPVDAFTKLTLDTIALCAFDYRFNSFYREDMHPFVSKALDALLESGRRAGRTALETRVRIWSQKEYDEHIQYCWRICDEIVADRKAHPREVNDLLNVMLKSADPDTGEMMRDELIRYEMMTFLLAGHDTTSGLLNFVFLLMLQIPRTLQAAQAEVDRVVGDGPLQAKHFQDLKYIEAVMRETLRLYPTAPVFSVRPKDRKNDTSLDGGRYRLHPEDVISLDLSCVHRDPAVWGDDAEHFRPERMLNGGFESVPPDSWKPFGNSFRACIGRALAWQEAWMAIALILQRFNVELVEPNYELRVRQTLTIKPIGWHMKARLRPGKDIYTGIVPASSGPAPASVANGHTTNGAAPSDTLLPLKVFYGSNQGTCKTFAESLQSAGPAHGYRVSLGTLDSATESIPLDTPVIFITPSYEGQPPDNGKRFVAWVEANSGDKTKLKGLNYAVFGAGNSDWVNTFHRIPKLVDGGLSSMGASQIIPLGLGNAAKDIIGAFDEFSDSLWKALVKPSNVSGQPSEELKLEMTLDRPELLGEKDMTLGTVRQHVQLADRSVGPEKRLMEVELPTDMPYRCGDYLTVLPTNRGEDVRRILNHFSMPVDAMVKISGTRKGFLPREHAEYAYSLIAAYLEIGTPVTRKQLQTCTTVTQDAKQKAELERLSNVEAYEKEILAERASVFDILQRFPSCKLSFAAYIDMLQPMKPRQYSIASSPLASAPNTATILYDVIEAPFHFDADRQFHGLASTYLAEIPVGGRVHCYVKSTNANFRLPLDPEKAIVMVCAGTGLAPMRGFIQERAAVAEAQKIKLGKAILYFGCRDPEKDYICRSELEAWEKQGVVDLRPAFSQKPSESHGHKHVPERIFAEREELVELFKSGAKVFLCGSASKLALSTNEIFEKIAMEAKGCGAEEAKQWLQTIKNDRYVTDIFG